MVDKDEHSNQLVVNTVDIDCAPDEVFALLTSEEGRESWLEPDPQRTLVVETATPPNPEASGRVAWWWWSGDESPRQVELWVIAIPAGTRVIAIESAPAMPLTMLAGAVSRRRLTRATVLGAGVATVGSGLAPAMAAGALISA